MKYLLDNRIFFRNKLKTVLVLFALSFIAFSYAQLPEKPEPASPVNDFANVLTEEQKSQLTAQLSEFSKQTSTQIVLLTVNDLQGYDKAQFAVDVAHKWGIGQAAKDNGILILVKPKTATSRGEAYIAVGYGLEGIVPDATSKKIVDFEMIPEFKAGNYFAGIERASKVLMEITKNEYTAEQYNQKAGGGILGLIPLLIFVVLFIIFTMKGNNRSSSIGSGGASSLLTGMFLGSMMGGRSNSGWGNFNSGGGSFGGGGFGGFGGGGFGGGGAGGSW